MPTADRGKGRSREAVKGKGRIGEKT